MVSDGPGLTASRDRLPVRSLEDAWNELDPGAREEVLWCRGVATPERSRGVKGSRVVVVMGAFDPPTIAHVRLAVSGGRACDAPAAFCLTKVLLARGDDVLLDPVKRLRLLDKVAAGHRLGLAISNRGTYLDVHRAMRATNVEATFVVGSDKLSQLADPSFYPDGDRGVRATFSEVSFLVVPRPGSALTRTDMRVLDPKEVFENASEASISSTEVRRRVLAGEDVEHLVPPGVARGIGGYTAAR